MPRAGFELWLARRYPDGAATVKARFSNIVRLESAYGSLDDHYRRDRCFSIISSLEYSTADASRRAPNRSRIQIQGNIQNGLSTLRNALKLYIGYLDEQSGRSSGLRRRGIVRRDVQSELTFKTDAPQENPVSRPTLASDPIVARTLLPKPRETAVDGEVITLLRRYAGVEEELRARGVVRTGNVLGDYAEWLSVKAFGWRLAGNSEGSFDATDENGRRIQIKARRVSIRNPSRQLSALRNLNKEGFDQLAGLLFRQDFTLLRAALIPRDIVAEQSAYVRHVNAWRFMLSDAVFAAPGVLDITEPLRAAQGLLQERPTPQPPHPTLPSLISP